MSEFADLLSLLYFKFKRILILGDSNIHIDQTNSTMAKDFFFFSLTQFTNGSTHESHPLDLVIPNELFVSQSSSVDISLSDHFAVFFKLDLFISRVPMSRNVKFQKWKSIDQLYIQLLLFHISLN